MPKQIIIAEQHRIGAVFWEDQIQELVVATGQHQVGDIYLGVVENVLPGIDAAFVNIGDPVRNGFIHVTDLGPLRLKKTAGAITELLAPQQKVLVQVMKEPTGNKGPRLTGNISLPGRYVVLMPFGKGVNLSRRIRSEGERNRLRALAILTKPAGMGVLVRTEAEGTSEEAIMEDLDTLQKQWETILQDANSTRPPALLNRDDDFIQRVLRDMYSADVNRIVVDSHHAVKRVKQYLYSWNGGRMPDGVLIDHHRERLPILEFFRVNAAIRESLKPRVDLPSGGYIIIEPTEALTVIDVNSGSFTRSTTSRETVLWTNCEAATEIARQLRLRNIAGVIIVDFIDMDYPKDKLQVLEHFNKQLRADKARPQIAQLSELGLVELTRKRQGQNIYELFSHSCPTCGGLGHLVHLPGESAVSEVGETLVPQSLVPNRNSESPRSIVTKDSRSTVNYPPTPSFAPNSADVWTGFAEAESTEYAEDDIVNPNYQDTGLNKKRRRRLGRDAQPTPIREETTPKIISRIPSRLDYETDVPLVNTSMSNQDVVINDVFDPFNDSLTETEKTVKPIINPNKPQRLKPTRPINEPPEIVSIEMSEREQDIYAWMGISPLIKLDPQGNNSDGYGEIRNPKTAIINLVPPGTLPTPTVIETQSRKVTEEESIDRSPEPELEELESDIIPESNTPIQVEIPTVLTTNIAEISEIPEIPEEVPIVSLPEIDISVATTEPPVDEMLANRRRRRRSSAIVDN